MTKWSLLIALFITSALLLPANAQDKPISTPAYFGGLDTLSKFHVKFDNSKQSLSDYKYTKGKDRLLGTIINDPRVVFSTYFGGNGYDACLSIAADSKGNIIFVGYSGSTDLPTTPNCYQSQKSGGHDAFIAKFTPEGQPIWITYFGGNSTDVAVDVVVDKEDNIIICGKTISTDLPTTDSSFQKELAGLTDCFLAKFTTDGQLIWCTYYGSPDQSLPNYTFGNEIATGMALLSDGSVVITGATNGMKLPVTKGTFQDTLAAHHNESDAFLARFSTDGKLIWGSYFGGRPDEYANAIAADKDDNIIITGWCNAVVYLPGDFILPLTDDAFQKTAGGGQDVFVAKFSKDCKLLYSTLYGGSGDDVANAVTTDKDGNFVICGYTLSNNFPVSDDAYQKKLNTDSVGTTPNDGFIVEFNSNDNRKWATYLGGNVNDEFYTVLKDNDNNIWLTGYTTSVNGLPLDSNTFLRPVQWGFYIIIIKFNSNYKLEKCFLYHDGDAYKILIIRNDLFIVGKTNEIHFFIKNAFQPNIGFIQPGPPNDGFIFSLDIIKTDVIETDNSSKKVVYPNPSSGKFNIKLASTDYGQYRIMIYDILGNNIYTNEFDKLENEASFNIDLSGSGTGTYFYKIISPNAVVSTGKFFIY